MKDKAGQQRILSKFTRPPVVRKLAAAVSGGCDSVAMLLLLNDWCRMRGIRLCVFHVDHGLRNSSADDALWVKDLAASLRLEFFLRKASFDDQASGVKVGSEAWARNFRYGAFIEMLEESGAEAVATGHSADDQAETIMMRLMRGCSWQGLGGISSRIRLRFAGQGLRVWRPLLKVARSELEAFLRSCGQGWREDETNQTNVYFRNRVRHQLLPLMAELQSGTFKHLAALGDDSRLLQRRISRSASAFIRKFGSESELKVYITPDCTLRCEIIRRWLCSGGRSERVDRTLISRVDALWKKKLIGNWVVYKDFCIGRQIDSLVVKKNNSGRDVISCQNDVPLLSVDKECVVALEAGKQLDLQGWRYFLNQKKPAAENCASLFFIPAEFAETLNIRCRQPGDRFYPAGGAGGKKLSRWFIDRKIPVELRDHLLLVVSGATVLLVTGYGTSRYVKKEEEAGGLWLSVSEIKEELSG